MCLCTCVGEAANVSQNEKQLIVIDTGTPATIDLINYFDGVVLIVNDATDFYVENLIKTFTPPPFIAPEPPALDLPGKGEYLPYKENKHFNPKYHARHLFNPVKTC